MKVVKLSSLHIGCLYAPGNIPGTNYCKRLNRPRDHSATRKIMSTKNSNDTIRNPTRDLPARSTVPQPTVPRAPPKNLTVTLNFYVVLTD